MAEESEPSIINPLNVNTIVVVSFILALLAVGLTAYNHTQTGQVADRIVAVEQATMARDKQLKAEMSEPSPEAAAVAALEQRIAALEARAEAATADAEAATPE